VQNESKIVAAFREGILGRIGAYPESRWRLRSRPEFAKDFDSGELNAKFGDWSRIGQAFKLGQD
jgi:hypothetical protein